MCLNHLETIPPPHTPWFLERFSFRKPVSGAKKGLGTADLEHSCQPLEAGTTLQWSQNPFTFRSSIFICSFLDLVKAFHLRLLYFSVFLFGLTEAWRRGRDWRIVGLKVKIYLSAQCYHLWKYLAAINALSPACQVLLPLKTTKFTKL